MNGWEADLLSFLAERFGQRAAAEQQVDIRLEEVSDELRVIERQLKQQHRADQKDRKTAEMSESETYSAAWNGRRRPGKSVTA